MHLFSPLSQRSVTFRNRVVVSPMCQYSARDGLAAQWHLVHLGALAAGGAGAVVFEATAVEARGRISPCDLGLWNDAQGEALERVVRFVEGQGARACLQLAHAGRKASVNVPWQDGGSPLSEAKGGWKPVAPSALPFTETHAVPESLTESGIEEVVAAFRASARRALGAGFSALEVHAAHGYLLHEFLSPLSNRRTDRWGGSFENRVRLVCEVVKAVRSEWPERLPLWVRLSCTDWVEGGWTPEETVDLARQLGSFGVDLMDCSSAGLLPPKGIPVGPGYQVAFAEKVRREAGVMTGAVGLVTAPEQADQVIRSGQADLVLLGRELLRNPHWPLTAAKALGHEGSWPNQYLRAR